MTGMKGRAHVSSKSRGSAAAARRAARRAPQHRKDAGRHREPSATVGDLVALPASASAKFAAAGLLGSAVALAVPGMASAATAVGPPGSGTSATAVAFGAPASAVAAPGPAAAVPAAFAPAVPAPSLYQAQPTIKVVIIGDSYTSGEGAAPATYLAKPPIQAYDMEGNVTTITQVYPQHVSSASPAMQAIAAIQQANPGVNIEVSNVAVSGATRPSAFLPSQPNNPDFTLPPQLDAVKGADIIINGFAGGDDNNFSAWAHDVLLNKDPTLPATFNSQFAPAFTSGANLQAQENFLNTLAQLAPGATIITPGYPNVFSDRPAASYSLASPVVTSFDQNAVTYSNLFGAYLNADANAASLVANAQNTGTGTKFYFADMTNALADHWVTSPQPGVNGLTLFSPGQDSIGQSAFHPDPLGQQMLSAALQPYLNQAFGDVGFAKGLSLNTNVAPVVNTPAAQQGATDAQSQAATLGQLQAVTDLAQLAQQAQAGQLMQPDGTPTRWGALMFGLTQPPAAPANSGQQGASGAGQPADNSQQGQPAGDGPAAPAAAPATAPGSGAPAAPGSGDPAAPAAAPDPAAPAAPAAAPDPASAPVAPGSGAPAAPGSGAPAAPAAAPDPAAPVAPAVDPAAVPATVPNTFGSALPVADPSSGLVPAAPVSDPAIGTGIGTFTSTGLGTVTDPLSGISTGVTTNLDTGVTSGLPSVTSLPSVAPIDNPAVSIGSTSFSSTDLGTSIDPVGGGSFGDAGS
jgi:hypothetical protein